MIQSSRRETQFDAEKREKREILSKYEGAVIYVCPSSPPPSLPPSPPLPPPTFFTATSTAALNASGHLVLMQSRPLEAEALDDICAAAAAAAVAIV